MELLRTVLLAVTMATCGGINLPFEVNNSPVQSCQTQFSIDSMGLGDIKRGDDRVPCSGYVRAIRDGNRRRLCASMANDFYDNAAKRLCYTTGTNFYRSTPTFTAFTRQVMLYNCFAYREQGVQRVGSKSSEYVFELEGQLEAEHTTGCEEDTVSEPDWYDCFDDCHIEGEPIPDQESGECAYNEPYWAVGCADINECVNGVFDNCTGPFETSCKVRKACGSNTECVNHVGSYECSCRYGFEPKFGDDLDPYNIYAGCVDLDECDDPQRDVCGFYGQCVNTPGSYMCVCPWREIWDPQTRTCNGPVCNTPWVDPNAFRSQTNGQPGDLVVYTCLPGYTAPDGSGSYTNLCAGGKWTWSGRCRAPRTPFGGFGGPFGRKRREVATRGENADCYSVNGADICSCKEGFTGDGTNCQPITCEPLPHIRHASSGIPLPQTPTAGDVILYTCDAGYQVSLENLPYNLVSYYGYSTSNSFQLTCDAGGHWTPYPLPHCLPVFCGDPGTVGHAERVGAGGLYEQEVQYRCKAGYHPDNKDLGTDGFSRTCQADGTWSQGTTCVDTNECEATPGICGPGKFCINVHGSYLCSCVPWYERDSNDARCDKWAGRGTLSDYKPCHILRSIGFCSNGECEEVDGYARCKCDAGYTGAACDHPYWGGPLITALVFLLVVVLLMVLELGYIFYHVVRKDNCKDAPAVIPLPRINSHPGRHVLPPRCPPQHGPGPRLLRPGPPRAGPHQRY